MNLSSFLESTPLAEAFLNTGIHSVLFSVVIALAYLMIRRVSPYVASAGLFTVLVLLAILPIIEFGPQTGFGGWWAVEVTQASAVTDVSPVPALPDATPKPSQTADLAAASWLVMPTSATAITNLLGFIWLGGIGILLLRFLRSLWQLRCVQQRLQPVSNQAVLDVWEDIKPRHATGQAITLSELDAHCSPFAFGYLHPRIVLPTELVASGSIQEIKDALLHELNHITSRDIWISAFQRIVVTLYWWNPLISWLEQQYNLSREKLCDMAVIHQTGDAKAYASTLVSMADRANQFVSLPAPARRMATSFSLLEERIKNIAINQKTMKSTRIKSLAWTACFTAISAGLLTLGVKATWAGKNETVATLKSGADDTLQLAVNTDTVELSVIGADGKTRTVQLPIGDKAKVAELQQLVGSLQAPPPSSTTIAGAALNNRIQSSDAVGSTTSLRGFDESTVSSSSSDAMLNEPSAGTVARRSRTTARRYGGDASVRGPALPTFSNRTSAADAVTFEEAKPRASVTARYGVSSQPKPKPKGRVNVSSRQRSTTRSKTAPRYSAPIPTQPSAPATAAPSPVLPPEPPQPTPGLSAFVHPPANPGATLATPSRPRGRVSPSAGLGLVPANPMIADAPAAAPRPKVDPSREVLNALKKLEDRMKALEERQAKTEKRAPKRYSGGTSSDYSY